MAPTRGDSHSARPHFLDHLLAAGSPETQVDVWAQQARNAYHNAHVWVDNNIPGAKPFLTNLTITGDTSDAAPKHTGTKHTYRGMNGETITCWDDPPPANPPRSHGPARQSPAVNPLLRDAEAAMQKHGAHQEHPGATPELRRQTMNPMRRPAQTTGSD